MLCKDSRQYFCRAKVPLNTPYATFSKRYLVTRIQLPNDGKYGLLTTHLWYNAATWNFAIFLFAWSELAHEKLKHYLKTQSDGLPLPVRTSDWEDPPSDPPDSYLNCWFQATQDIFFSKVIACFANLLASALGSSEIFLVRTNTYFKSICEYTLQE